MGKYKYVFFDMDGTIGDTREGIFNCTRYGFEKLGKEIDDSYESLIRVIGPPLVWAYQEYFGVSREDAEKVTAYYRERYSKKGIYEMNLYNGIENVLKKLVDSGIILAVVSAKPEDYIDRIMKHFGIDKYFSYNSSASKKDTDTSKVRLIKRSIEHFGIDDLSQVVMVGDRKYDLEGASDVGIDGIGVTYGFGSAEELNSCKKVFIAKTPDEIYDYIISTESK